MSDATRRSDEARGNRMRSFLLPLWARDTSDWWQRHALRNLATRWCAWTTTRSMWLH